MYHYAYCINETQNFTVGKVYQVTYPTSIPWGHTCYRTINDNDEEDRIYYGNKDNFIFILNTNKHIDEIKTIFESMI